MVQSKALNLQRNSQFTSQTTEWEWRDSGLRESKLQVASGLGLPFPGKPDPSTELLVNTIERRLPALIVNLNCGNGLAGAAAALSNPGSKVLMTDRNFLAFEATRMMLGRNRIPNAEAHFCHGLAGLPTSDVDQVLIRLPKGKVPALQLVWDAFQSLRTGGRVTIAGANNEGIQSILHSVRQVFGNLNLLGYKAGHRVGTAVKTSPTPLQTTKLTPDVTDHDFFRTFDVNVKGVALQMFTRPGVFAWDRLDEGTKNLLSHIELGAGARVLDLGCGGGVIGLFAARLCPDGFVDMVDVDAEALRSAQKSAIANRILNCAIIAGGSVEGVLDKEFDAVVSNPPFHLGRNVEYSIADKFFADAHKVLRNGGRLMIVANITLPYERSLSRTFGKVQTIFQDRRFKVLAARKA